jgi:transposase
MFPHPDHHRYSPRRPWAPLTDAEFAALRPFFTREGAGRPLHDLRGRLNAVFWVACQKGPWRLLPRDIGPADTASRQFRRWVGAGIWTRLLKLVARPDCPPLLRRLEHWICRAYRRALRLLGLPGLALAQRLGLRSALPAPWWMLPKPDLSESWRPLMARMQERALALVETRAWQEARRWFRALIWMHRFLGGASRIPRCLDVG